MTTFITRETARDSLVTLFGDEGSWQAVYGYMPPDTTYAGQSPVLTIRSAGTGQDMAGLNNNPTEYRYRLRSYIKIIGDESAVEDQLDDLDMTYRQVVRDNAAGVSGAGSNYLRFGEGPSETGFVLINGELYRWEEWTLSVHLPNGQ